MWINRQTVGWVCSIAFFVFDHLYVYSHNQRKYITVKMAQYETDNFTVTSEKGSSFLQRSHHMQILLVTQYKLLIGRDRQWHCDSGLRHSCTECQTVFPAAIKNVCTWPLRYWVNQWESGLSSSSETSPTIFLIKLTVLRKNIQAVNILQKWHHDLTTLYSLTRTIIIVPLSQTGNFTI